MNESTLIPPDSQSAGLLGELLEVMVAAADPARVLLPALPPGRDAPARVIGAGKAAAAMAAALDRHWGGALEGFVVVPYGYAMPAGRIRVLEAAHPLPDMAALDAGAALLESARLASSRGEQLVCLLSGGASSLACMPPPGVSLADKRAVVAALLHSGVDITAINAVRKHLSLLKGGRLALAAWPAPVLVLAISDVPGDDPAVIGSGPFSPDPVSSEEALAVLAAYRVPLPPAVKRWLEDPAAESPKPGDARFATVDYRILCTPGTALAAAVAHARARGSEVLDLGAALDGPAEALGHAHAALARERLAAGWRGLILSGGETSVEVQGTGRGGRNSQYLLALFEGLRGETDVAALAADTDGVDGSGGAGAWFDATVVARAELLGLVPGSFIRTSDSHGFFATLGSALPARPTRTNVNDFRAILVGAH
jgi:glycerate 2-kinase